MDDQEKKWCIRRPGTVRPGAGKSRMGLLAAMAILAGGLCAGCTSLYTAERIWLMKTEGEVDIANSRGKELEPVPEMKLYSGYDMETREKSYAWIDLDSARLAKMDASSQIRIDKKRNGMEVVVESGKLFFNIKEPLKEDETLDIRTSNMSVGIRGTCGWVEVQDEEHMRVYILEGTVTCTVDAPGSRESKEAFVSGGQMAKLTIDPEAEKGQICEIVTRDFTVEDIAGFVLEELIGDEDLCEKIYEASGLEIGGNGEDVMDVTGNGSEDGTEGGDGSEEEGDTVETRALDPEAESAWQQAYLSILNDQRAKNAALNDPYSDMGAWDYQLYDIDKDGVPELFLHFGSSEAGARADIYTCRDGEAVLLEKEMGTGHTVFCTWPGDNGMLSSWGHMGYGTYTKISLADGKLTEELLYEEELGPDDKDYLPMTDIVPGTVYISECRIQLDILIYRYREIARSLGQARSYVQESGDNASVRQRYLDVIREDGMVYGASADGYGGDTGYLSFAEYRTPGMLGRYGHLPLKVQRYAFADVDLDGQEECILQMAEEAGQECIYVVLRLQEDTVYAYAYNYFGGEVLQNGMFVDYTLHNPRRMIFDGDECLVYHVQPAQDVDLIQWEDFGGQTAREPDAAAGEALPIIDPMELGGRYTGSGQGAKASVSMYTSGEEEHRVGNIQVKSGSDAYYGELVWAAADTYKIDSIGKSTEWEGTVFRDVTAADGALSVEAGRENGTITLWFYRDGALIDTYKMTEHYVS